VTLGAFTHISPNHFATISKQPCWPHERLSLCSQVILPQHRQNREIIWLCAVVCRIELRKMGDPTEEAQNCQNRFKGFVSQRELRRCIASFTTTARRYPNEIEIRKAAEY